MGKTVKGCGKDAAKKSVKVRREVRNGKGCK